MDPIALLQPGEDLDVSQVVVAQRDRGGNGASGTDLPHEVHVADSLEREAAYQSLATTSDDLVEGMAAFKERRDPRFTGR